MTLPPAGWYADPVDPARLRWWDGAQWTQATTPAAGPAAEPERQAEESRAGAVSEPAHQPAQEQPDRRAEEAARQDVAEPAVRPEEPAAAAAEFGAASAFAFGEDRTTEAGSSAAATSSSSASDLDEERGGSPWIRPDRDELRAAARWTQRTPAAEEPASSGADTALPASADVAYGTQGPDDSSRADSGRSDAGWPAAGDSASPWDRPGRDAGEDRGSEPQGYGAGTYGDQGYEQAFGTHAPSDQGHGGYGSSGPDQGYASPGSDQGYASPGSDQGFGSSGSDQGYGGHGPADQGYASPGSDQGYASPGSDQGFGHGAQGQPGQGYPGASYQGAGYPGQGYADQGYAGQGYAGPSYAGYDQGAPQAPTYGATPYPGQTQPGSEYPSPFPGYPGAPMPAPTGVPPGGKASATPDGQHLAGLGARLVAKIVDWIVLYILGGAAAYPLLSTAVRRLVDYSNALAATDTVPADPFAVLTDSGSLGPMLGAGLVFMIVTAVYTIGLVGWTGATLGKLMLGIRVRAWDRPGAPTYGQATKRYLSGELAGSVVGLYTWLDYLWPLWDGRKQALHDKWPGTVVVRKK